MKKINDKVKQIEYIKALSYTEALRILLELCKDSDLAKRIYKMAKASLSSVNADDIANNLYQRLTSIQVEDLWDNSGKTRWGYKEPFDVAYDMIEEVVSDFVLEMNQYRNLEMKREEKEYCKGIIVGLLKYGTEGGNEFYDWVPGDPYTIAENILDDWKEKNSKEDIEEIQALYDSFFSKSVVDELIIWDDELKSNSMMMKKT